jgi:hypothetical protein
MLDVGIWMFNEEFQQAAYAAKDGRFLAELFLKLSQYG